MSRAVVRIAAALLAGLVFGSGLIVSGMANPAKVLGFLDVAGNWNPTLAFVMVGALLVAAPALALAGRRSRSYAGADMQLPARGPVDRAVVIGGLVFGVGWGLAGFCPGPAFVAAGAGVGKALVFVAAMGCGMAVVELWRRRPVPGRAVA